MSRLRPLLFAVACVSLAFASATAQEKRKPRKKRRPHPAFEKIKEDPNMPRVLLIGDSISIGYTVPVRKLLEGKANVLRIPANGGPTTRGVQNLDKWLDVGKLDVIHFNFGLHDARLEPDTGKCQVDLKSYEENLRKIVERLKKTGAKLIWATTTAVVDGPGRKRRNSDIIAYNEAALRVMKEAGIQIDDLYSELMKIEREKITTPDGTHFTPEGYDFLAKFVAASICKALGIEPPK